LGKLFLKLLLSYFYRSTISVERSRDCGRKKLAIECE